MYMNRNRVRHRPPVTNGDLNYSKRMLQSIQSVSTLVVIKTIPNWQANISVCPIQGPSKQIRTVNVSLDKLHSIQ